jgi:tetratricopeptide (TPR) repeat protein
MPLPDEYLKHAPPPRALTGADQWNVFLSYRSVNRPWVLNLYDVLRQQGHKVFLDQVVLKAGDRLIKGLQNAIQTCQAGVLVWSENTGDSDWVQREYETMEALASDKPGFQFVPLKLDAAKVPLFAKNRIFLDFSSYPDGPNGGELLRLFHALVGVPLSPEAAEFAARQDETAQEVGNKIGAAIRNKKPERILELFRQGGLPWQTSSALACRAAQGLTELGRYDDAIAILRELETQFPKAIRPQQLRALALARQGQPGDLDSAQEILGTLYDKGERDAETLGIYARTWMDRYAKSGDVRDLKESRRLYVQAFDAAPDDYYTGINAASKSVFLGTPDDLAKASEYAERVQRIVGTEPKPDDYWWAATVGELFLIRRLYKDAARLYDAAVSMAQSREGDHHSTWTQASRLMSKLNPTDDERALIRKVFAHLPDANAPGSQQAANA